MPRETVGPSPEEMENSPARPTFSHSISPWFMGVYGLLGAVLATTLSFIGSSASIGYGALRYNDLGIALVIAIIIIGAYSVLVGKRHGVKFGLIVFLLQLLLVPAFYFAIFFIGSAILLS